MLNSSKITVLLERQKESGLSIRSFCSNEGIAQSTFYYWHKKLRKEATGGRFIPLLVRAPGSAAYPALSQRPAPGMHNTPLEITYPNGTTLRIRQTLDLAGLRSRLAYPFVLGFEKLIVSYMPEALPKGRMSQALTYTYSLFHRLSRYHLNGRYKIDNNLVENTIRPLALGRKNYMFCGNHDAAENAAIMYSLPGCCAALDVNHREWLTDALTRIPYHNNNCSLDLADILPHNWKACRELQNAPLEIQ